MTLVYTQNLMHKINLNLLKIITCVLSKRSLLTHPLGLPLRLQDSLLLLAGTATPSWPYEYAGNHLSALQNAGLHTTHWQHDCLSFFLYVRQILSSTSCGAAPCTLMNLNNGNYEYDY